MASDRSLANLKSFKPGQSGNPNGRPKKKPEEPTLRDWQDFALANPGVDRNGAALPCRNDIVMRTHFMIASDRRRKDCMKAIEIWYYRVYGKVPDKIEHSGEIDTGFDPLADYLAKLVADKQRQDAETEESSEKAAKVAPASSASPTAKKGRKPSTSGK